jgi:hypothetical protein
MTKIRLGYSLGSEVDWCLVINVARDYGMCLEHSVGHLVGTLVFLLDVKVVNAERFIECMEEANLFLSE